MPDPLPEGLYELAATAELAQRIADEGDAIAEFAELTESSIDSALTTHVAASFQAQLATLSDSDDKVRLANQVLGELSSSGILLSSQGRELRSIHRSPDRISGLPRPTGRISETALLTNARGDASIGAEVGAELRTADSVDLICAFIRWTGLRTIADALTEAKRRGTPLRVLTTTYMGATERKAIDRLVRDYGAEVRISYETQSTRLHAKAWLFHRHTGFGTAYIGSSNLSQAAMLDGLEWNVRVSNHRDPHVIQKFATTYESYWESGAFLPYDPDSDAEALDEALRLAGASANSSASAQLLSGLEVTPRPHQVRILDALTRERVVNNHHRNLVVAATGTGKTIVAGLDYQRLRATLPSSTLLFVAHRKEILEQARRSFREILGDPAFGELYVDGSRPRKWQRVFASIQGLNSFGIDSLAPEQFDVVVIDEFHHAEAASYQRVLTHFKPRELVGLTATPERADGVNVSKFFDGRVAAELRLWDALDEDLLVPFHYFGVSDGTDLSGIEWKRGGYDLEGLAAVYTGNDARANAVLRELRDKVVDIDRMRALGFCVSVAHAEYMARYFTDKGIASVALHASSARADRDAAGRQLIDREVACIFTVDLFNEGVDIPEVDTVLFLRPTESSTVFLQQLGRGLRRCEGKSVLTVLDYVGQQNAKFRFDLKLRALTHASRRELEKQIENGFPFLPSGCRISLDRVAQKIILDNVKSQISFSKKQLIADIASHRERRLAEYLSSSGRELVDIYRSSSWTDLVYASGLTVEYTGEGETGLLKRARAFVHVNDPERASTYRRLLQSNSPTYDDLSTRDQTYARMMTFTVWSDLGGHSTFGEALNALRASPAFCDELDQILALGEATSEVIPQALGSDLIGVPLYSHAHYKREEILAALNWASLDRRVKGAVTGVQWCEDVATDVFFVNLHKTDSHFSDTTMYKDYAMGPQLFHWESQGATATESATGRRYIEHRSAGTNVLLFTRDTPENEFGAGAPFTCLGLVDYVSHTGSRPIAFTWRLRREMPADVYQSAAAVVV
ncbi:DUF3427 domain-containing protein [Aeromicrobium sp. CF3.5]|uniref:DUF3427 domain-containing protein n=1 Tax=Aeromicrobium sp. CF3.5 TaxID=3373078 RepID=UPI003EE79933